MPHELLPPAIVLGLSPTGLHVVRSLARAGVEVFGVAEGKQAGATSKYLSGVIDHQTDEQLLSALLSLGTRLLAEGKPYPILMPSSDQHVDFIVGNHAALTKYFRFQASYSDGLAQAIMAKDSFYKLCDQHGVEYPKLIEAKREDLLNLVTTVAFPWMIKPAEIHTIKAAMQGEKGWIVKDTQELEAALGRIPDNAGTLLVQEIVPGPESNITLCCGYVDTHDTVRQMFSARKLRQFPPGFGSASLVQSNTEPDSVAITKNLLTAINYHGIAASEFKRHPETGKLHIIEINVRPSLWFSISEAAGRPVVLDAYRDLAGLTPLADARQKQGIRWRYGLKDLASKLFYWCNPDFILPPPNVEAVGTSSDKTRPVFAYNDLKPAFAELWFLLQKAALRFKASPERKRP